MSIEQFESTMLTLGYNEEQIAAMKNIIQELAQTLTLALEEIIQRVKEFISSLWDGIKETMAELAEKLDDYFKQPTTQAQVQYVSYNPPNDNAWYKQYTKKMISDKRADIKTFLIHKY